MARKKASPLQKAYTKERQRIQRQSRSLMRRGIFVDNLLPSIPKRITEGSIRRLQRISREKIESTGLYVSESGDVFTGKYAVQASRRDRAELKKRVSRETFQSPEIAPQIGPSQEDISRQIIDNFFGDLLESMSDPGATVFRDWLGRMISTEGEKRVADMIKNALENGYTMEYWQGYRENDFNAKISEMKNYFPVSETEQEEFENSMEQTQSYN